MLSTRFCTGYMFLIYRYTCNGILPIVTMKFVERTKFKSMLWFSMQKSSQFKLRNTSYTFLLQPRFSCLSRLLWPCCCIGWFDAVWFKVCLRLHVSVFSMSWYGYRYLWHCALVSSTPWLYSQSDWFMGVRCSSTECHQVLLSLSPR